VVAAVLIAVLLPGQFGAVHRYPAKVDTYGMLGVWAAIWWILRGRERPRWVLYACDLMLVLAISLLIGFALPRLPPAMNLHFEGLFLCLLVLVLRAAMVPSPPQWTAAVCLLCGPAVVIGGFLRSQALPPGWIPLRLVLAAQIIWWLAMTAAATAVSRTIHGLVTQVSRATRLGQYTLVEKIGEGGMGEVYRAQHALLRRPTAIKLLLPGRASPQALSRFEREVQLTSLLAHPNTIAIHDYGRTPDGIFYYAMEYLEGVSLDALVAGDGPTPPGRVVHILMQVAESLAEAHGAGLVHRDVKPANIMLCERGGIPDFIKVLDFGLVKQIDASPEDTRLTSTTAITGTPLYMAPEAITSGAVDGRTDIYALGGVAYFLLTGTPPFSARTVMEICGHHLHSPVVPPGQRLGSPLPPALEALVLRCLAKDPAQRFDTAQALHAALVACKAEAPWGRADARAWWVRHQQARQQPANPLLRSGTE
jgi:serine/threonine-protein kinase